jgi:hypothetical protein
MSTRVQNSEVEKIIWNPNNNSAMNVVLSLCMFLHSSFSTLNTAVFFWNPGHPVNSASYIAANLCSENRGAEAVASHKLCISSLQLVSKAYDTWMQFSHKHWLYFFCITWALSVVNPLPFSLYFTDLLLLMSVLPLYMRKVAKLYIAWLHVRPCLAVKRTLDCKNGQCVRFDYL